MTARLIADLKNSSSATVVAAQSSSGFRQSFESVRDVARLLDPDAPVLCFSRSALEERARLFLDRFPGETAYAVKANSSRQMISGLAEAGVKVFDVASLAEVKLVASLVPSAELHYHNPVKSCREISAAYAQFGCRRFAVDHSSELEKIANVCGKDEKIEIAVRFRLPAHGGAVHDFSEKFGCTPDVAVSLLRQVKANGYRPVLTFHPGSQCTSPGAWRNHIEAAAEISMKAGASLHRLNVGGGFPVKYAQSAQIDLQEYFNFISHATVAAFGQGHEPDLECEPGRALAAPCMALLTRIKMIRPETREVFLNDGIYGNMMEMYQAPGLLPSHHSLRADSISRKTERNIDWTIYGPTCDPLDKLPMQLDLPEGIAEDDFVIFTGIGAYCNATATGFNGYGHAEIVHVESY